MIPLSSARDAREAGGLAGVKVGGIAPLRCAKPKLAKAVILEHRSGKARAHCRRLPAVKLIMGGIAPLRCAKPKLAKAVILEHRSGEARAHCRINRIAGAFKRMKYLVGYSGGADSQVALDLALKKYDDVEIIFIDTSIEYPETLDMMTETAKFYELEIKFLRAGRTFEEYLESFGGMYPSWRRRWCQDRLKERPLKKYINSVIREGLRRDAQEKAGGSSRLAAPHRPITVIDGIRSDESAARKKRSPMEPHRSGKWDIEHIVFEWTKPEIFAYIQEHDLPLNPLYEMGYSRTSCWFCPFKPIADNQLLALHHPELYEKAQEWSAKYGRRFCYPVEDCSLAPHLSKGL